MEFVTKPQYRVSVHGRWIVVKNGVELDVLIKQGLERGNKIREFQIELVDEASAATFVQFGS